jgi:hypothetical protein
MAAYHEVEPTPSWRDKCPNLTHVMSGTSIFILAFTIQGSLVGLKTDSFVYGGIATPIYMFFLTTVIWNEFHRYNTDYQIHQIHLGKYCLFAFLNVLTTFFTMIYYWSKHESPSADEQKTILVITGTVNIFIVLFQMAVIEFKCLHCWCMASVFFSIYFLEVEKPEWIEFKRNVAIRAMKKTKPILHFPPDSEDNERV